MTEAIIPWGNLNPEQREQLARGFKTGITLIF